MPQKVIMNDPDRTELDLNDSSDATLPIDVPEQAVFVTVQANQVGGLWVSPATMSLRVSNDGQEFFNVPANDVQFTAPGITDKIDVRAFRYIRFETDSALGLACRADLTVVFSDRGD